MRFIVGLFAIGIGILVIKYRKLIFDWTGHWGWADRYVGSTPNAIVLLGLAIIFLGVVYPTGALDRYFNPTISSSSTSSVIGN